MKITRKSNTHCFLSKICALRSIFFSLILRIVLLDVDSADLSTVMRNPESPFFGSLTTSTLFRLLPVHVTCFDLQLLSEVSNTWSQYYLSDMLSMLFFVGNGIFCFTITVCVFKTRMDINKVHAIYSILFINMQNLQKCNNQEYTQHRKLSFL